LLDQQNDPKDKNIRQEIQEQKNFFRNNSELFLNAEMRKIEKNLRERKKYTAAPKL